MVVIKLTEAVVAEDDIMIVLVCNVVLDIMKAVEDERR